MPKDLKKIEHDADFVKNSPVSRDKLKPQGDTIFALDIGTRTVVGILGENLDGEFKLSDFIVEPHTKRAMVDGQIEDVKLVTKVVAKLKEQLERSSGIALERVAVAAAGRALKTHRISLSFDVSDRDSISEDMIKSMEIETVQKAQEKLDEECKAQKMLFYCVGYSVVSYIIDGHKIINLEAHKGQNVEIEIIATFLPNIVVEGLYTVMNANYLEVTSLTLEPIAAMNVIIPAEIRLINIALVDIGAGTSDIAVSRDGSIVAYAMATIAGDEITEEIIREFFVDFNTAEKMKHASTSGVDSFEYRDIFGITQNIKTGKFNEKINKAIENLADTICNNINQANGGPPSAVFLVGGGALITDLDKKVAGKLNLDETRVKIGDHNTLRNIDTGGQKMGAEFVTPLGIAVTAIQNQGYDFSVVTLNDKKIRIFDTRKISIFDLLTMEGYKTNDIVGRSGRSLTFMVDGKARTIKGGIATPAEVTINDEPANINAHVTQGDRVVFKPAVCGENAHALISEIFDLSVGGTVEFSGEVYNLGLNFTVNNNNNVLNSYEIQSLDKIELSSIVTLEDLLNCSGVDFSSHDEFLINNNQADFSTILKDGDVISYSETKSDGIFVELNGEKLKLPPNSAKTPYIFLELLNNIEFDKNNPPTSYVMKLNGENANFNSILSNGDKAEINWKA